MAIPRPAADAVQGLGAGPHVLTIGNFDGVHRGHQHLLKFVVSRAEELGVSPLVMTFEPHPIAVLRPEQAPLRIATPDEKIRALHAAGIDEIAVIPFDLDFAALTPHEFLTFLSDAVNPTDVYVGDGFRFGRKRAGDIAAMQEFGAKRGFKVHTVEPLMDDDGVISSSRVRAALLAGEIETASELLGRRFRLRGTVEQGMARGRDLGYPTANLEVPTGLCIPQDGIYVGYAHVDDESSGPREALIYIGTRPTFGDRERVVEVNILDYRGDLYSCSLQIEFIAFVRPDRAFDSAELLMKQMAKDELASREILAGTAPEQGLKGD